MSRITLGRSSISECAMQVRRPSLCIVMWKDSRPRSCPSRSGFRLVYSIVPRMQR